MSHSLLHYSGAAPGQSCNLPVIIEAPESFLHLSEGQQALYNSCGHGRPDLDRLKREWYLQSQLHPSFPPDACIMLYADVVSSCSYCQKGLCKLRCFLFCQYVPLRRLEN